MTKAWHLLSQFVSFFDFTSQFNIDKWVERGYPNDITILYQETIEAQLGSPNTVLDVRFPEAAKFLTVMHEQIFDRLHDSLTIPKTHDDRLAVADAISEEWKRITREYDSRPVTKLPLKAIYQKSMNAYVPPNAQSSSLSPGQVAGIVVGCILFVAILFGLLLWWVLRRERERSDMQWQVKREELRLTEEILGEGTFGVS